jgi:hypothetical protein
VLGGYTIDRPTAKTMKVALEQATIAQRGSSDNTSTLSLISALDGGGWFNATPRLLQPRERIPGTHCTGGWVGPRAGLNGSENLASTDFRSRDRPARSESLYRLSYPGPRPINSPQPKPNTREKQKTSIMWCLDTGVSKPLTALRYSTSKNCNTGGNQAMKNKNVRMFF